MASGVLDIAYNFIKDVCNDIDPETSDPKEYLYFVAGSGNDAQRWGREILNGYYRFDCSSLIGAALIYAGMIPEETYPYFWTGNMEEILVQNGFNVFDPNLNTLQPGDILLTHDSNMQHTEMLTLYNESEGRWYSMGARSSHLPLAEQVSIHPAYMPQWKKAFRPSPLQTIIPDIQTFFAKRTGGFLRTDIHAFYNACMTASVLMTSVQYTSYTPANSRIWSRQAVCALLGNMEIECGYNFGRWERDIVVSGAGYFQSVYEAEDTEQLEEQNWRGYGCVQFTPCWNYIGTNGGVAYGQEVNTSPTNINGARLYYGFLPCFSENYTVQDGVIEFFDDAYAQLIFLANEWCASSQNWIPTQECPETYEEFYSYIEDDNVEYLTEVFCRNLERPNMNVAQLSTRKEAARYWWDRLNNWLPIIPETPGFIESKRALWKMVLYPSVTINIK